MVANLGFGFILLAFLICLYAIATAVYGLRSHSIMYIESSRIAAVMTLPILLFSIASLLVLLLAEQYPFTYVYNSISHDLSWIFKISALWSGQSGVLLMCAGACSLIIVINLLRVKRTELKTCTPWVVIAAMSVEAFFLVLLIFFDNPFQRLWVNANGHLISSFNQPSGTFTVIPSNGLGMDPRIQNLVPALLTPLLILSFAVFLIPFAYSIATLTAAVEKRVGTRHMRNWMLVGWVLLALALFLEGRWAYLTYARAGYWSWTISSITILMPLLTATAYLHVSTLQERTNRFKRMSYLLVMITFCLALLAVALRLSFTENFVSTPVNLIAFILFGLACLTSLLLIAWRWKKVFGFGELISFASREAHFLLVDGLMLCLFLVCLVIMKIELVDGTYASSQLFTSRQWYSYLLLALLGLLLLLMGISPLTSWGGKSFHSIFLRIWRPFLVSLILPVALIIFKASSIMGIITFWLLGFIVLIGIFDFSRAVRMQHRNTGQTYFKAIPTLLAYYPQKLGINLLHMGVAMIVLCLTGSVFMQQKVQADVLQQESIAFHKYSVEYAGYHETVQSNGTQTLAMTLKVTSPAGKTQDLHPALIYYSQQKITFSSPAIWSTFAGDLYIRITEDSPMTIEIYFNPFMIWAWIGIGILAIGAFLAFSPNWQVHSRGGQPS